MAIKLIGDEHVLGTYELARACGVAARTVTKWVDGGMLRGYKLPPTGPSGTPTRRVRWSEANRFMAEHGLPRPEWFLRLGTPLIVWVGRSKIESPSLAARQEVALDVFEAGLLCSNGPSAVVVDAGGVGGASQARLVLKSVSLLTPTPVRVVVGTEDAGKFAFEKEVGSLVDCAFDWPGHTDEVALYLIKTLGLRVGK